MPDLLDKQRVTVLPTLNADIAFNNLSVIHLPNDISKELSTLVQRNMNRQFTIQDGQVWLSDGEASVMVEPEAWK